MGVCEGIAVKVGVTVADAVTVAVAGGKAKIGFDALDVVVGDMVVASGEGVKDGVGAGRLEVGAAFVGGPTDGAKDGVGRPGVGVR